MPSIKPPPLLYSLILGAISMITLLTHNNYINPSKTPVEINIEIDDKIKNDIGIYINPQGHKIKKERIISDYEKTDILIPITIDAKITESDSEKISSYSDYDIYATYKGKYAVISTTNTIVLGQSKTKVEFKILADKENRPYLSRVEGLPEEKNKPSEIIGLESYFYDKDIYIEQSIESKYFDKIKIIRRIESLK